MAGYHNYSMSNSAIEAYNRGLKPMSRWSKREILDAVQGMVECEEIELQFDFDLLKKVRLPDLKCYVLSYSESHHTSKFFNLTKFYEINTRYLEGLTKEEVMELIK